jgi:hypothetical protein
MGLNSLLGQSEQDLIIDFSEIDSLQYIAYKKEFSNKLIIDSTKKTIPDSSFSLIIKNTEQLFDCQKDNSDCHYYKGFLPQLSSFIITHCGMSICETFLIDQTSGEIQNLLSPYDNECKAPVLSKNHNKLLVYASSVFDRESFISIYQKSGKNEDFDFKSYKSLTIKEWRIYEVIWINNTSFALITFDKYGGKTGSEALNVKYIKG